MEQFTENCSHYDSDKYRFAEEERRGYSTNVPRCLNCNYFMAEVESPGWEQPGLAVSAASGCRAGLGRFCRGYTGGNLLETFAKSIADAGEDLSASFA